MEVESVGGVVLSAVVVVAEGAADAVCGSVENVADAVIAA
jgi:hypothetical protein